MSNQPTNSIDSELEDMAENLAILMTNATLPERIQIAALFLSTHYVSRKEVEEAIGEDEKHQDSSFGGALPAFETEPMKHRNQFRAELRAKLLNKETE